MMIYLLFAVVLVALFLVLRRRRGPRGNWIVVDGSNVLYWDRETPDIVSVRHIVDILKAEGFAPVVWFDANVGYLIGDRYLGPAPLADRLGLPKRHVLVAAKGTPADPLLLKGADRLGACVVTNDRFRDWEDDYPRIREAGFLVRGYIRGDEIGLDLPR